MDKSEYVRLKYLAQAPGSASEKELIAKRYLGGPSATKKKKKAKFLSNPTKTKKGNLGIVDEDDIEWGKSSKDDIEEESEGFKFDTEEKSLNESRMHSNGWKTIREPEKNENNPFDVDTEEWPQVVGEIPDLTPPRRRSPSPSLSQNKRHQRISRSPPIQASRDQEKQLSSPRMSSGAKIGLQTYEESAADMAYLKAEQDRIVRNMDPEASGRGAETVYRDRSGKKVDMTIRRAEEARVKREEMEREEKRMEWGKGLVQRREAEERKKLEEEEQAKPFARYKDDEDMNNELKEKQMWNDPAAAFLTKKKSKGPKKPVYKGPWPPNRFNIPPGYRWDGVDRSNGFESDLFARRNLKTAREKEAYAWASEDM